MPTYTATIHVRLTEETMEDAISVAQEQADILCANAMTDCATVHHVVEENQKDAEQVIRIVDEEINKVIAGTAEFGRDVCEADLICARINIVNRIREN